MNINMELKHLIIFSVLFVLQVGYLKIQQRVVVGISNA
jgi:hypothetical protein